MPTARNLIVINKAWEADPVMAVLNSSRARPAKFPSLSATIPAVTIPLLDGTTKKVAARAAYDAPSGSSIEAWCIQDLMDPTVSSSSSEEKARVLPFILSSTLTLSAVIAVGTAASPWDGTFNGCVIVGSNVFVHDPYQKTPNPKSHYTDSRFDSLVGAAPPAGLSVIDRDLRPVLESRFLSPPLRPASPPVLVVSADFVAVSSVNVTNYSDYVWVDPESMRSVSTAGVRLTVGSVDTTHGVIRLVCGGTSFSFVSGIANRLGYLSSEVTPRDYAQNFVAAHNCGVAVAGLISTF